MAQSNQCIEQSAETDSVTAQIAEFLAKGNEITVCEPQAKPRKRFLAAEPQVSSKKWERARPITFKEYWDLHGVQFLIDQYALYCRLPERARLNYNNGMLYSQSYKHDCRLPVLSYEALELIGNVVKRLKQDFEREHYVFIQHMIRGRSYDDVSNETGESVYSVAVGVHKAIGYIGGSLRHHFEKE